jgi:ABC-2 type transport system ATP-binding protein
MAVVARPAGLVLSVEGLVKNYGAVRAVDNLSFRIMEGEIYGLLGPNGAGKTTTIKSILGLHEVQAGRIAVLGDDPLLHPDKAKEHIGYVAEEPLVYGSITPRELFNFVASIRGLEPAAATQRAQTLLSSLDALQYYDSLMATLSHGTKQKMQVIAALLHSPKLLILDEPLVGLDAKAARVVKEIVSLHLQQGGSVLLSTHILEVAQNLCIRIGVINRGAMVAEGTLEELRTLEHAAGASLEEVFLKLTDQEQAVKDAIEGFRQEYRNQKPSG